MPRFKESKKRLIKVVERPELKKNSGIKRNSKILKSRKPLILLVGARRFELPTPCSQNMGAVYQLGFISQILNDP